MALCSRVCLGRSVKILQSLQYASSARFVHGGPSQSYHLSPDSSSYLFTSKNKYGSESNELLKSSPIGSSISSGISTEQFLHPCSPDQGVVCHLTPSTVSEYQCPTRLAEHLSRLAILEAPRTQNNAYKCPVSHPVTDTIAPDTLNKSEILEPGVGKPVAKEAKMIMRIRHKKMKKHKLRKLRKRMYFLWKKQKQTRKAKRMTIYNRELDEIKQKGEDFDAEEFVRSQVAKARRGGFYINVFESRQ